MPQWVLLMQCSVISIFICDLKYIHTQDPPSWLKSKSKYVQTKVRDQLALPRSFEWIKRPCYSPDPSYGALQELQLKLKLKDTIISSTQEELEAEGANSSRKPVTEEETLEVKEETAIMQVTVVAAICYFPAGPFYLLLSVCNVKHGLTAALNATRLVVSPISCSFSLSAAARCWYGLSD